MTRIIAAVDQSAAARPVVRAAVALAPLFDATVDVVHVRQDGKTAADSAAASAGLKLRVLEGRPASRLVEALGESDVVAGVLGARAGPGGPRPSGHTALGVVAQAQKPVVVVPPEWTPATTFERVIVPLDASDATSMAVQTAVTVCARGGLEILVLHVFSDGTVPHFWDHPAYEEVDWAREFLSRHCAEAEAHIALRSGAPAREVLALANRVADLVMIAWSQDLSGTHAQVVREMLADSPVPVMLVPTSHAENVAA